MTNNTCPICSDPINADSWATVRCHGKTFHRCCADDLAFVMQQAKSPPPQAPPFVLQDAKPCRRCERGVAEMIKAIHTFYCRCQSCGYEAGSAYTQDIALKNWESGQS